MDIRKKDQPFVIVANYEKRLILLEEIGEKKMNRIRQNSPNSTEIEKTFPRCNQATEFLENKRQSTFFN